MHGGEEKQVFVDGVTRFPDFSPLPQSKAWEALSEFFAHYRTNGAARVTT